MSANDQSLVPPQDVETPCLVIDCARLRQNLQLTAAACGGAGKLVPHVKTHRAPWLIADLLEAGVTAFKTATPAEVDMVLEAGAAEVIWAYPSTNPASIRRVIAAARRHPEAAVSALVDSAECVALWRALLAGEAPVRLRVDLDPGMGRTGLPFGDEAAALAHEIAAAGLFAGWHCYDGHIHGPDRAVRAAEVEAIADALSGFLAAAALGAAPWDLIVGGSYSYDLWPELPGIRRSPGSWVYSSMIHARDLPEQGWRQAAFVLASVVGSRGGRLTLNAGSKAVGADMVLGERFGWPGAIEAMSEEHTVVEGNGQSPGDVVLLTPGHACTTAYLYDKAWVRDLDGAWSQRTQLGARR